MERSEISITFEPLVKWMVGSLSEGTCKDQAMLKMQEVIWWSEKTVDEKRLQENAQKVKKDVKEAKKPTEKHEKEGKKC